MDRPTKKIEEIRSDLDKALRQVEFVICRKSLFNSWPHCKYTVAMAALRDLTAACDADLSREEQPQRSK